MKDLPDFKIGLFAIGLDTYWPQFPGLKERLENYVSVVEEKLAAIHPQVLNLGLVDNVDAAFAAGRQLRAQNVDIIFLYVTTYALSSTVLPVVQRAKVPVILLNLAPEAAIDYTAFNALTDRTKMTGEWLGLPRARDCQRVSPHGHSVSPSDWDAARRPRMLAGNHRVGRGFPRS